MHRLESKQNLKRKLPTNGWYFSHCFSLILLAIFRRSCKTLIIRSL
jgi:hypothetical protein